MNLDGDLQGVIDQFAKFEVPPIEKQSPNSARNNLTLKNAVEEMSAESITARTAAVVSPIMAEDVSGLPPAIISTAEFDPLRDEGEAYAKKLTDAGVSVKAQRFDGVSHEFFGLAGVIDKADEAHKFATEGLQKVFEICAAGTGR